MRYPVLSILCQLKVDEVCRNQVSNSVGNRPVFSTIIERCRSKRKCRQQVQRAATRDIDRTVEA